MRTGAPRAPNGQPSQGAAYTEAEHDSSRESCTVLAGMLALGPRAQGFLHAVLAMGALERLVKIASKRRFRRHSGHRHGDLFGEVGQRRKVRRHHHDGRDKSCS